MYASRREDYSDKEGYINFVIFVRCEVKLNITEQGLWLLMAQQLNQDQVLCRVFEQYFFLSGLGSNLPCGFCLCFCSVASLPVLQQNAICCQLNRDTQCSGITTHIYQYWGNITVYRSNLNRTFKGRPGLCSSPRSAWVPQVTNFCIWMFSYSLSAGHPGFHG